MHEFRYTSTDWQCFSWCESAGTLPLERPPGTALAWETLSAQDKAKRPGHAVTQAKREHTAKLLHACAGVGVVNCERCHAGTFCCTLCFVHAHLPAQSFSRQCSGHCER
jgi:hypothetical protein